MYPKKMTISRFAQAGGVGVETIRFYQREGLLPIPVKTDSGYREYHLALLKQLQFIRNAQTAGFSLAEIKQLLLLNPITERKKIQVMARHRLEQMNEKIQQLQRSAAALQWMLNDCQNAESDSKCPIISAF